MPVPVANLRPVLEAARSESEARLAELFARSHFILGHQLSSFEGEFAAYLQAGFAVGVGNGTDAISLALRDSGATGDVLTTGLTAPFTAVGIGGAGCTPRFADVDPDTLQIDPADAANRLRRKTSAIVAVHLYGQPCEIDRIATLARAEKKILVQDACQAHGALFHGKPLAALSTHVAYSFYPTKNLGCLGDGGAIVTNKAVAAKPLRMLRDGGRKGGQVSYGPGINSRLDEMQCCYLRAFLPRLEEFNQQRRHIAERYDQALAACPGIRLLRRTEESVCHLYVIRAEKRDRLREFLTSKGIGSGIHYPVPLHLHPGFAACGQKRGDLPNAERACREIVSLPIWPGLAGAELDEVASAVLAFYKR